MHSAAEDHDAHDTGPAYEGTVLVPGEYRAHQSRLEAVELSARVAEPCEGDQRRFAEQQQRAGRKRQEVDPSGGDVLAHVARADGEASLAELVLELAGDQVYLPEVGLPGIDGHARTMLHGRSAMSVTSDAEPGDQLHLGHRSLAEPVHSAAVNARYLAEDHAVHLAMMSAKRGLRRTSTGCAEAAAHRSLAETSGVDDHGGVDPEVLIRDLGDTDNRIDLVRAWQDTGGPDTGSRATSSSGAT